MKKKIYLLAALLLAFTLSACGLVRESFLTTVVTVRDNVLSEDEPEPAVDVEQPVLEAEAEPEPEPEIEAGPESEPEPGAEDEPETEPEVEPESEAEPETELLPEDGTYTTKDEVALYIFQYGRLPDNFITKREAEALGWPGGDLEPYAPGKCIGGNHFGNYEGRLPEKEGRKYTECDIDTLGKQSRGAKRIVFSNDGLIYYTEDHYETFELLYGEEQA